MFSNLFVFYCEFQAQIESVLGPFGFEFRTPPPTAGAQLVKSTPERYWLRAYPLRRFVSRFR